MDISLILIFIFGLVLGGIAVWFFWRKNSAKQTEAESPAPTLKTTTDQKTFLNLTKTEARNEN
jgi:flagellar basal body-associated protein FliL